MFSYGQYCPIAKSAEILGDRWTLLIVRELRHGVHRFNEFHRGLPGISRSVLVERLRRLEDMGVIERRRDGTGRGTEYHLTEAGEDLGGVIKAMGLWAAQWVLSDPTPHDTDPDFLILAISRHVAVKNLPRERVVVLFELRTGRRVRPYWLVLNGSDVSVCRQPPGFEVDLVVRADASSLHRVYLGRLDYAQALRSGNVELEGPRHLVRAFPTWMQWSQFAPTVRQAARP